MLWCSGGNPLAMKNQRFDARASCMRSCGSGRLTGSREVFLVSPIVSVLMVRLSCGSDDDEAETVDVWVKEVWYYRMPPSCRIGTSIRGAQLEQCAG